MISIEEKKYIEVTRKYKLSSYTMKLAVFRLFYEGYSPAKVKFILRNLDFPGEHRTFSNTIRRCYSLWKKAQAPKVLEK
jgi:hypothetical protein